MNMEKTNHWLTLFANLGVLIGIIFLALEVQQNNLIAKAQMRSDIMESGRASIDVYRSPEGIAILAKRETSEEYTLEERLWLNSAFRSEFRAWENVHYQYRVGLYDQNEMDSYRVLWKNRASQCDDIFTRSFYELYQSLRLQIEPNFRSEFDGYFSEGNCQ